MVAAVTEGVCGEQFEPTPSGKGVESVGRGRERGKNDD